MLISKILKTFFSQSEYIEISDGDVSGNEGYYSNISCEFAVFYCITFNYYYFVNGDHIV